MEAKPVAREFGIQNVTIRGGPHNLIHGVRDDADDLGRQFRREGVPGPVGGLVEPIRKDFAVRIAANLDDGGVFKSAAMVGPIAVSSMERMRPREAPRACFSRSSDPNACAFIAPSRLQGFFESPLDLQ